MLTAANSRNPDKRRFIDFLRNGNSIEPLVYVKKHAMTNHPAEYSLRYAGDENKRVRKTKGQGDPCPLSCSPPLQLARAEVQTCEPTYTE
jgi:hypothetical protein